MPQRWSATWEPNWEPAFNGSLQARNDVVRDVNWRFTAEDARIKVKHLYPQLRLDERLGEVARLAWGEVTGVD